jgi:hypothetical protein
MTFIFFEEIFFIQHHFYQIMGEMAAEAFRVIVLIPLGGAVLLAMYGYEYQWLVNATPTIAKFGLLVAAAVAIGGLALRG